MRPSPHVDCLSLHFSLSSAAHYSTRGYPRLAPVGYEIARVPFFGQFQNPVEWADTAYRYLGFSHNAMA